MTRTVLIAIIVSFLLMMGIFTSDIYVPALPEMAESLNASQFQMELSVALYFLSFSLSQLVYGPLSDRFGRKPIILMGLTVVLIGSILCMWAENGETLILGRLVQAAGMGALTLGRVILRDLFTGVDLARWNSYISVFVLLAPALAPILGGYLAYQWGWPSIFIFLILFILAITVAVIVLLPETRAVTEPLVLEFYEIFVHYKFVLKNKIFLGYAIAASIALAGMVVYLTLSSFLFQEKLGFSIIEYSWISVFVSAALVLGMVANAGLLYYFNFNQLIIVGLLMKCVSGMLLLMAIFFGMFSAISVVLSIALFSFGCSLVFANASSGAFTSFNHRLGMVGALYGAMQMMVAGIAGTLVSFAQEYAEWALAISFLLLGIIGLFSFLKLLSPQQAYL